MESTDVVHDMGVVVLCGDWGERIEVNRGVAFGEKGDDCLETTVFEMMDGVTGRPEGIEGIAADEADPGKTDGEEEAESRLSTEMFDETKKFGDALFRVEVTES